MDSKQPDDAPERMDYRVLATPDGEDGESLTIVQAWYWSGQDLPWAVDPVPAGGSHLEDLRGDLRAMLAATERPPLVEVATVDGKAYVEGEY